MTLRCLVVGAPGRPQTTAVLSALEALEVHTATARPGKADPEPGEYDVAFALAAAPIDPSPFRAGVWWLSAVHGGRWPGASAGVREVADGLALTGLELRGVGGVIGPLPRVIADAWPRTDPYSVARQRWRVDELAVELIQRGVAALANDSVRPGPVCARPVPPPPVGADVRRRVRRSRARGFGTTQLDETLRSDHWTIGVVDAPVHRFLDPTFRPSVSWLPVTSREIFAADPFGVERADGAVEVWYEHFDYRDGLGRIATRAWCDGFWSEPTTRMRADVHLSYPFLARVGDEDWMLPEAAGSGGIMWTVLGDSGLSEPRELIDFPGLDPTLFRHDGRWWLLATDLRRLPIDALHAWHAESPEGPWEPHALNPIKVDVRSSRPAGAPFVHDGVLYRPAQDGTDGYGSAVAICRIDELTPTSFRETVVSRVLPLRPFSSGIHTLSSVGRVTLVDGKRRVFVPSTVVDRMRGKFSRLRRLLR